MECHSQGPGLSHTWVQIPPPPPDWLSDKRLNFSQPRSLHLEIGKNAYLIGLLRGFIKYHDNS